MTPTPAMQQYYDLKKQYSDCVLFFRMGDFYEMFEQDAHTAHKVLGISITSRNKNSDTPIALAWIPFHAKEKYLPLLIEAGYKVAIAEQVSDPKLKWIVAREVVRVVTPSTLTLESEGYQSEQSTLMLALTHEKGIYGMSWLNISDNTWKTSECSTLEELSHWIYKISPAEWVLSRELFDREDIIGLLEQQPWLNIYCFDEVKHPNKYLCTHFWVNNLHGFGIEEKPLCQSSSALVLDYIIVHQKWDFWFLQSLTYQWAGTHLEIDESSLRSLDIIYNFSTQSAVKGTLLWVLNQSKTPMGKRFMREQLLQPLQDIKEIEKRQDIIEYFQSDIMLLDTISHELKQISDIDAIINRLALGRALPRDLLNLKKSLSSILRVLDKITESGNKKLIKALELDR